MMNQAQLLVYGLKHNDKVFQFLIQPGSTFEEVDEILNQFKKEFSGMKIEAEKQLAEKKAQEAPVDAEIVNE